MIRTLFLITALFASSTASATLWSIDGVQKGTDNGFRHSVLHKSSASSPMSANGAPLIEVLDASGSFNDATGELSLQLELDGSWGMLTLTSFGANDARNMDFGSDGYLTNDSILRYNFSNATTPYDNVLQEGIIGVAKNDVCCSGTNNNDPNSLSPPGGGGASGVGLHYMTLWAANLFGPTYNSSLPKMGYNDGTTFGMDLRLDLNPVPVPAAVWLFGTALLGLFGWQRRKASV